MRSPARLVTRLTLASFLLAAAPALADEPAPPSAEKPSTAPAPPAADAPIPEPSLPATDAAPANVPPTTPASADKPADNPAEITDEASRGSGIRLGLDLGFQRAFDGAADRLNKASPTLLPIGVDFSFRTSNTFMVGAHGYAALASRDDCISVDSCRARAYGFGAHIEGMLARGRSWVAWIRYGIGYEILYQGGQPLDPSGHLFRDAVDLIDLRFGADLTVHRRDGGKTMRIGPFLGLVAGTLVGQSGVTHLSGSGGRSTNLERGAGSAHVWFAAGVRATLDP